MSKGVAKKKLSIKKVAVFILILTLFVILFVFRLSILYFIQSKITGYDFNTISYAHKYNVYKDLRKHDYSKTFDRIITSKEYNNKFALYYLGTKYRNNDNYFDKINTLFSLGYNDRDVNTIYDTLDDEDINMLIKSGYYDDVANILKISYVKGKNIARYIEYAKGNKINANDIVTYVNIGLDKEFYTDIIKIDNPDNVLVLVNKYNTLDKDYIPSDLVLISNKFNKGANNKLRKVAKENFEEMCESALKDDIKIYNGSAFRSFNYQLNLYNRYVSADGIATADTYAARAGHSEHQTGLALDILNHNFQFLSSGDKEHKWLINNSYKYGFILRYPKDKEDITGYMFEEWHFRYVGRDTAKVIHNEGITFDEYIARQ